MITVNKRDKVEWKEGMTVQDLMDAMGYDYALITVTVGGILVPEEDYGRHVLADGADVNVFHLAHGG